MCILKITMIAPERLAARTQARERAWVATRLRKDHASKTPACALDLAGYLFSGVTSGLRKTVRGVYTWKVRNLSSSLVQPQVSRLSRATLREFTRLVAHALRGIDQGGTIFTDTCIIVYYSYS